VYFAVGIIASALVVRLGTLLDVLILKAWRTMGRGASRSVGGGASRSGGGEVGHDDFAQWRKDVLADSMARVHIVSCASTLQVKQ
jgi:hypothetical protein